MKVTIETVGEYSGFSAEAEEYWEPEAGGTRDEDPQTVSRALNRALARICLAHGLEVIAVKPS